MTCRVLLADDHVIVREGLKNILLQEGFEVAGEASDGKRAVELAKGIRPDIALIDFSMPEGTMNVLQLCRDVPSMLLHAQHRSESLAVNSVYAKTLLRSLRRTLQ